MKKLTIIRGLPGSGKSTLAKELANSSGAHHVEADMYFINSYGEYVFDGNQIEDAHRWCYEEVKYFLNWSCSVIVSNTFTRIKEIRPYYDLALEFGITPQIITCQGSFGSIHGVPDHVMVNMKNRFAYDLSDLYKEEVTS